MSVERQLEIELKYHVADDRAGRRILRGDHLAGLAPLGPVEETRQTDRYFDTRAGSLAAAGYAARIRETADQTLLTVKSLQASETALHRREELEAPATPVLDARPWPASNARSLVLELSGNSELVEVARLHQVRRRRRFGDSRTTVELSLDEVSVARGDATVDRFTELEVELTQGPESSLASVAAALAGVGGLEPAHRSKLERALATLKGPVARPARRSQKSPGVRSE